VEKHAQTSYIKTTSLKFVHHAFIDVRLAEIGNHMIVFNVKMAITYKTLHVMKYALLELGLKILNQIQLVNPVKRLVNNVQDL